MTDYVGPVWTGRFEDFVVRHESGRSYRMLYLADLNNYELQQEGKPPAYYWVPGEVHLARTSETGDFKFHHLHFVGTEGDDVAIGPDDGVVSGGLLTFTTSSSYPAEVHAAAEAQLRDRCRGKDDRYWGWKTNAAPAIAIAPITANVTGVSNITPNADGTAGQVPSTGSGKVPLWAWKMDGPGQGSVTGGENAYSAFMGSLPSQIVWDGFHSAWSPIIAIQTLTIPVWSESLRIVIDGKWEQIADSFASQLKGHAWFVTGDIKAAFTKAVLDGKITVKVYYDGTTPGSDADMKKAVDARVQAVYQKFMDLAGDRLFKPGPPQAAQAAADDPSGPGGILAKLWPRYGASFAFAYKHDATKLTLHYDETEYLRYNQVTSISSTLEGVFEEMKRDPEAEGKYFDRLVFGGLQKQIYRIVAPIATKRSRSDGWPEFPLKRLTGDVAYPSPEQGLDHKESTWTLAQATADAEGNDPSRRVQWTRVLATEHPPGVPEDWTPEVTYVARRVSLAGSDQPNIAPYGVQVVEAPEVAIDPPGGTPIKESMIPVNASAGILDVQIHAITPPLLPGTTAEIEFQRCNDHGPVATSPVVPLVWTHDDQKEKRLFSVAYADLDEPPGFRYRATVRGPDGSVQGPWLERAGGGQVVLDIPQLPVTDSLVAAGKPGVW